MTTSKLVPVSLLTADEVLASLSLNDAIKELCLGTKTKDREREADSLAVGRGDIADVVIVARSSRIKDVAVIALNQ